MSAGKVCWWEEVAVLSPPGANSGWRDRDGDEQGSALGPQQEFLPLFPATRTASHVSEGDNVNGTQASIIEGNYTATTGQSQQPLKHTGLHQAQVPQAPWARGSPAFLRRSLGSCDLAPGLTT